MNLGLIPARLKSTRLPNKPLLEIDGLPMIVHVMKRAKLCSELDKVIVCTDSDEIFSVVKKYGGEAIKTKFNHINGTERISEVAKKIKKNFQLIIDIQCDEVFLNPDNIGKLIKFVLVWISVFLLFFSSHHPTLLMHHEYSFLK